MNFVINVSGRRPLGWVEELRVAYRFEPPRVHELDGEAELHHLEHRRDHQTGATFVALVYRLPDRP